jgi:hypothetical protein
MFKSRLKVARLGSIINTSLSLLKANCSLGPYLNATSPISCVNSATSSIKFLINF